MASRIITEQAKLVVLQYGPDSVLEFGEELVRTFLKGRCMESRMESLVAPILDEATIQASRVYRFLGFERSGMVER